MHGKVGAHRVAKKVPGKRFGPPPRTQLLTTEGIYCFVVVCQQLSRKPVLIVAVLDCEIAFWHNMRLLWQSEGLEFVVDVDLECVCIPQGPCRHSTLEIG